ncbi:seven-hairpin glycosidase [Neoconidiobolus thromboides FSU 785]|nr:seven-hairpin glycosidase [Neoconidiobolus thromboides FSU 785]
MRDAKNVERSSSFSWVPKLLKGSSDKVQGARWEALDRLRRLQIRKSFLHSWNSYKELAFGHDQILPLRKTYTDDFGMTLFDNLDTLIIMGLKEEFENAKKQALSVDFSKLSGTIEFDKFISSCLGGLLGAYELTNDDDLLAKAEEVAQLSMIAFETSHGLPTSTFKFNGDNTNEKWTTISKLSSFQLEFIKLGKLTDNQTYIEKANLVRNLFDLTILDIPGIFPTQFDIEVIKPSGKSSLDKDGGRYYDVLFKEYLLLNKKDQRLKEKYLKSLNAIQRKLVIGHPDMGKTFLGGLNTDNQLEYAMSHYSCFFPGLIALSSHVLNRVKDIELAENITSTCLNLYKSAPTQLAPEHIYFLENYFSIYDANFLLSSETVESLFYLYRRTKNRKYQQMGWDIFIAIEKHCKVKYGYSTYDNVLTERKYQNSNKVLLGEMPSSFLSKTLKYLYLLFSPLEQVPNRSNSASSINDPSLDFHLDLNAFILSPGAHPLKIITDS